MIVCTCHAELALRHAALALRHAAIASEFASVPSPRLPLHRHPHAIWNRIGVDAHSSLILPPRHDRNTAGPVSVCRRYAAAARGAGAQCCHATADHVTADHVATWSAVT
eukprot:2487251-Prymnesium_polylepis.2